MLKGENANDSSMNLSRRKKEEKIKNEKKKIHRTEDSLNSRNSFLFQQRALRVKIPVMRNKCHLKDIFKKLAKNRKKYTHILYLHVYF